MEECKKCGSKDIKAKYQPKGELTSWNRNIDGVKKFMRNDDYYYQDQVEKEHLIYTCNICGYRKAEPTKDN